MTEKAGVAQRRVTKKATETRLNKAVGDVNNFHGASMALLYGTGCVDNLELCTIGIVKERHCQTVAVVARIMVALPSYTNSCHCCVDKDDTNLAVSDQFHSTSLVRSETGDFTDNGSDDLDALTGTSLAGRRAGSKHTSFCLVAAVDTPDETRSRHAGLVSRVRRVTHYVDIKVKGWRQKLEALNLLLCGPARLQVG